MSVLVILGSAREDSHTLLLVDAMLQGKPATRIDLRDLDIHHYEYGQPAERDDFIKVADAMTAHTAVVFATPVYWYAMSGRMKVLFDRFTDVVTVRKDLGRRLKGRTVFVAACGSEPLLPEGFEVPFRDTAAYLEMNYGGTFYAQTSKTGMSAAAIADAAAFGVRVIF
jgi:multimeric flavodoxin WrbA